MKFTLRSFFILAIIFNTSVSFSQSTLVAPYTSAISRAKVYRTMVERSINKNLSLPFIESNSDYHQDAFYTLELLNYRSPWIDGKIIEAVTYFPKADYDFQRSLLELLYTNYKNAFSKEIGVLALNINDPKLFAMAMEYLMTDSIDPVDTAALLKLSFSKFPGVAGTHPILKMLMQRMENKRQTLSDEILTGLISNKFIPGKTILYSFQKRNRDQPGFAMLRDSIGNFVRNDSGSFFTVPHFARSLSSLPFYLTNGNTPQGIYRMYGFGVSSSQFIGPSVNIQMCMPVECAIQNFFNDSTIIDSTWTEAWYEKLLPPSAIRYSPLYEAYYAGAAGRTEIIAHGTAVDPKFYKDKPYYPHTPSMGCLTTSEIWDDNGRRIVSNQQKLIDALVRTGGAYGYCVVIELPDWMNMEELFSLITDK